MILDHRLLAQTRSSRGNLILAVALGWVGGVLTILQAGALSRVITAVFLEQQTLSDLRIWLLALLGLFAGRSLLQLGAEMAAHRASNRVRMDLRRVLVEHILALGPMYTQGQQTGEQAAAALQGVDNLDAYFSQYFPQVALSALLPATVLAAAFPIDWLSGLVLLLTAPLIPLFMVLIGQASEAVTRRQFSALGRMSAFFLDTIQGLTTLRLLNQSAAQASRISSVSQQYRQVTLGVLRVTFLSALVLELVGTLSTAVIAVQIGLRLLEGALPFEQAFFILILAPEFYLPLRLLGLRFHAAEAGRAAAQRIFEVLSLPLPLEVRAPQVVPPGKMVVEFDRVRYTYPDRTIPALEDVSFTLQPGRVTALVGTSGAGKSTAAALLMAMIRPQGGVVSVNGIDLARVPGAEWRARVGWLPQKPHLFRGSIADNLRIANLSAPEDRLRTAIRQAHLDEFIRSLPKGLETPVGEGGVGLSGGQAQRLALARAFLADAPLLVVDEPTAWLDVELELALTDSLVELSRGKTVLLIAHRLQTVQRADWVVVMEAGRVAEQGTPGELTEHKGPFWQLLAAGGSLV